MSNTSKRDRMPIVTAFVDDLREAFGAAYVNAIIRAGMRGEPESFHATECGEEIGTAWTSDGVVPYVANDLGERKR